MDSTKPQKRTHTQLRGDSIAEANTLEEAKQQLPQQSSQEQNLTPDQVYLWKQISVSSAWYHILPYLSLLEIVQCQGINSKFYK